MEIGSFIELQMPRGKEYHTEKRHKGMRVARLNSGRAAIWHAFRLTNCAAIWIPYYQCETVRDFLGKKGVCINYYHIDHEFTPVDLYPNHNDAVLLVNYYGTMSFERMEHLAQQYEHVIIDNSQAFFCEPIVGCQNVYSCRKFIGVPDGAYVVSQNANDYIDQYERGYSSDTALFLLQRIEYGCEGKTYASRMVNEERIDNEDIKGMSALTQYILDGTDYELICQFRKDNFSMAHELFQRKNKLNPIMHWNNKCVPMVYPLLIENDDMLSVLLKNKHFQGHWWKYVTDELEPQYFEHYVSRYMVPITIDQRYGVTELQALYSCLDKAGI